MQYYRFSPIKTPEEFEKAISYLVIQTQLLSLEVVGKHLPFDGYLTVFSHYQPEYDYLCAHLLTRGSFDAEHNGIYVSLHQPIHTDHGVVSKLRVRKPDPYRLHVGCGDYAVSDYAEFKAAHLTESNLYIREIIRPDIAMIEFWHPDYDVLGYVVKNQ